MDTNKRFSSNTNGSFRGDPKGQSASEFVDSLKCLKKDDISMLLYFALDSTNRTARVAERMAVEFRQEEDEAREAGDYADSRWHAGTAWGQEIEARHAHDVLETFEQWANTYYERRVEARRIAAKR